MNKKVPLLSLFLFFVKMGAILLGGGYVILPIITNELCHKRKLVKEEDVIDYFAISQSLPGIIAANISMFIGYKLRGKIGSIVAMLGIIFVPFLSIILLASILGTLVDNSYVQSVLWGVGIAVVALIMLTIRELWQKSNKDIYFYSIFLLALISIFWFHLTPIKTIIIFTVLGVVFKRLTTSKENRV